MPNHCHNDLWIRGNTEDVANLLAYIGADKEQPAFDFNTLIPYPEKFKQMDQEMEAVYKDATLLDAYKAKWGTSSDGYNSGGYDWCHNEWGTKWNAYGVARRDYMGICLSFQTAWAPPAPVILALAKMFPKCSLSLEYLEQGGAFAGGFSCESEDDWYDEDEPWEAVKVTDKWEAKYRGKRGG